MIEALAAPAHRPAVRSTLINRNITVAGRRTSVRLEASMWAALTEICEREGCSLSDLVTSLDSRRRESSLTAAIRVYAMEYFRAAMRDSIPSRPSRAEGPAPATAQVLQPAAWIRS